MSARVLTHATEPRAYKLCRCHECGKQAVCTPRNDFYTRSTSRLEPRENGLPLVCEACILYTPPPNSAVN